MERGNVSTGAIEREEEEIGRDMRVETPSFAPAWEAGVSGKHLPRISLS